MKLVKIILISVSILLIVTYIRSASTFPASLGEIRILGALSDSGINIGLLSLRTLTAMVSILWILMVFNISRLFGASVQKSILIILVIQITPIFVYSSIFTLLPMLVALFSSAIFWILSKNRVEFQQLTKVDNNMPGKHKKPEKIQSILNRYTAKRKLVVLAGVLFMLILCILAIYFQYLVNSKKNVFDYISPVSNTYIIDKNLSFGAIAKSPLVTKQFNYNRIAHNKLFYGVNELFKQIAGAFNLEKLFFPMIAGLNTINIFYFWQLPLTVFSFLAIKRLPSIGGSFYLFVVTVMVIIFSQYEYFVVILPILSWFQIEGFRILINKGMVLYSAFLTISCIEICVFLNLLLVKPHLWFETYSIAYPVIFNLLSNPKYKDKDIIISDRLGNTNEYVDYYSKLRSLPKERFNITSFDLTEITSRDNKIWVGLPKEFVGKNVPSDEKYLKDVRLIFKTSINNEINKEFGDEVWIAEGH